MFPGYRGTGAAAPARTPAEARAARLDAEMARLVELWGRVLDAVDRSLEY